MTESVRVLCLLDRFWDPSTLEYDGTEKAGLLIDISVQSVENDDPGKFAPVGIVLLDDNTFVSVPMEFIKKTT